jgi:hypothetical protein
MTGEYTGPFFAGGLKLEADDGSYCITQILLRIKKQEDHRMDRTTIY